MAVEGLGLSQKEADRCRNFFAMGLVYWLYGRDAGADAALHRGEVRQASRTSPRPTARRCKAGWNYGETTEAFASSYQVDPAKLPPGTYRNMMGNQALAWGLIAAAKLSGKRAVSRHLSRSRRPATSCTN